MANWLTWSIQLFEAYSEDWAESTSRKRMADEAVRSVSN